MLSCVRFTTYWSIQFSFSSAEATLHGIFSCPRLNELRGAKWMMSISRPSTSKVIFLSMENIEKNVVMQLVFTFWIILMNMPIWGQTASTDLPRPNVRWTGVRLPAPVTNFCWWISDELRFGLIRSWECWDYPLVTWKTSKSTIV